MKILKVSAAVLASMAALLIVAAGLLLLFFDPNDYKGYVTSWVEERTGRAFVVSDDLELAFFPWLAVEAGGIELGNPEGFDQTEPFATAERVAAAVKLMPLLDGRIEIGGVRVDGLELRLVRDAAGRGNWQNFAAAGASRGAGEPEEQEARLRNLDIESVLIRDGRLYWRENADDVRYVASGILLETGRIGPENPVDVALSGAVLDVESQRTFGVEWRSRVAIPGILGGSAQAAPADGASAAPGDPDAAVDLRDFELALRLLDDAQGELASGRLVAARIRAGTNGAVSADAARVTARLPAGEDSRDPSGATGALDVGAEWSAARFDPGAGSLDVDGLRTEVAGLAADWRLSGRNLIDAPELEGAIALSGASFADALATLGIAPPAGIEPDAMGAIEATAAFSAALSLPGSASSSGAAEAGVALGPYRLTFLRLSDVEVEALGLTAAAAAELGADGVLRASLDVPAFTPGDTLRAIATANAPEALDFSAVDRLAWSGRIEADLESARIAVRDMRAALLGAELAGELEVLPQSAGKVYRGTLQAPRFEPQRLARFLGPLLPAAIAPEELGALALDTRFEYDAAADRLALEPLSLEVFGLAASGQATVADVASSPTASGRVRVAAFSPRDLMRRFGQPVPDTSDPSALQRATIDARFDVDAERGRFDDIDMTLDDSRVTGQFAVDGFKGSAFSFALAIDRVDADRYLPPRSSEVPEDADTPTAGDIELPAQALRNLDLNGRVSVGELRLAGLDFQDVSTDIAVGDGRASLDSAHAKLYGGEFAGSFRVNTVGTPGLTLTGRASSLALEPIIVALTGDANVSGTGDFDLDLAGSGATVAENVANANGNVTFSLRDGVIDGFNLGRAMCAVYNTARRLPAPAERPSRTEYQLIGGSATVENGVATSPDLLARASFMDLAGTGSLTLAEQRLDYDLEAKLTGSVGIPGCESMDSLIGESLPLTLRGTVTDPAIRPDFSEIIERRIRDEVRDRIGDRLQERLQDLLR